MAYRDNLGLPEISMVIGTAIRKTNIGRAAYHVRVISRDKEYGLAAAYKYTTRNRINLLGCIVGLESLRQKSSVVVLSTSDYLVESMRLARFKKWMRFNFGKYFTGEVANVDLWFQIMKLCEYHSVSFYRKRNSPVMQESTVKARQKLRKCRGHNLQRDLSYENNKTTFKAIVNCSTSSDKAY